jgi:Cu(I)/Ag(I) efflux system membrane fusion protein
MKNKVKQGIIILIVLIAGVVIGSFFTDDESHQDHQAQENAQVWTCSMHQQIRQQEPGNCPICDMELIPVGQVEDQVIDPDAIKMTATARELANVQTMEVGNDDSNASIRLDGEMVINEEATTVLTAEFDLRIEQLFVNSAGELVDAGQPIARIYSPTIEKLQREIVIAQEMQDDEPGLLKSLKNKLRNWKFSEDQIDNLLSSGGQNGVILLKANKKGYITSLNMTEGKQMEQEEVLYEIADLNTVWAVFDVYEDQVEELKTGDPISIRSTSGSSKKVDARIDFISPRLTDNGIGKIRATITNSSMEWKPGQQLNGDLKTERKSSAEDQIVVPHSAVLWTGKRSVVFVQHSSASAVSYQVRQVEIAKDLGDQYLIADGLQMGETIVTQGAFSVDAALQLAGKPSMMNQQQKQESITSSLKKYELEKPDVWLSIYLDFKNALVDDDLSLAQKYYRSLLKKLFKNGEVALSRQTIQQLRNDFIQLNDHLIPIIKEQNTEQKLYVQFCPMANDSNGALWLSKNKAIKNPYYGASMLTCGSVQDSIN